jgi:3-phosphoshikimate 1-carboxyvinyltransferase
MGELYIGRGAHHTSVKPHWAAELAISAVGGPLVLNEPARAIALARAVPRWQKTRMADSRPLLIEPRGPLHARVQVPGSKSISNRALLVAGLARGESQLRGVLDSDDTRVMARALEALGAKLSIDGDRWSVSGVDGKPRVPSAKLDVGASGTAARFLTALIALVPGEALLDGSARMRERPIAELVDALRRLGVRVTAEGRGGCPPVRCVGGVPFGGETEVDARRSSQYVSALLLVAPYAQRSVELRLTQGALVSRPYVEVTLQVMQAFGAEAEFRAAGVLHVTAGRSYEARDYAIEPDASTAAYFFAAAAIAGGRVAVEGLPARSAQADMGFLALLERMGCRVDLGSTGVEVHGPSARLKAVDVDMNAMPDAVLAAAVTALFAEGTTRIRNVGNLRIKESDRLAALETELCKLGASAHADADSLTITPGPLHAAEIATYDDHRMAMAFALVGLRVNGVRICDPGCVSKSWPGYFEALGALS